MELCLQVADQLQDLPLDGHVERRCRFVGDQQRGPAHQRHGDHRALAEAAGQLERIGSQGAPRIGKADMAEHIGDSFVPFPGANLPVQAQGLSDLVADRVQRRQRRHRFLENDRNPAAADRPQAGAIGIFRRQVDCAAVAFRIPEQDFAAIDDRVVRKDAHQRLGDDGLAATALADQRHRAASRNIE